jgi:hypothetical protein
MEWCISPGDGLEENNNLMIEQVLLKEGSEGNGFSL